MPFIKQWTLEFMIGRNCTVGWEKNGTRSPIQRESSDHPWTDEEHNRADTRARACGEIVLEMRTIPLRKNLQSPILTISLGYSVGVGHPAFVPLIEFLTNQHQNML
jgi:hypothetical protein